jgi:hypothetical protein
MKTTISGIRGKMKAYPERTEFMMKAWQGQGETKLRLTWKK